MSIIGNRQPVGRLPPGSAPLTAGHHYLRELKCPVCGWTLTVDDAGPRMHFPLFRCEGRCQRQGFTSFLEKTNDGN